jgi:hypothetical protein
MKTTVKYLLLISIVFFSLVVVMMLAGGLTFGHGLGDIAFIPLIAGWTLGLIVVYRYATRNDFVWDSGLAAVLLAILVFSIFYTARGFTVARGPEYRWNGKIFLDN